VAGLGVALALAIDGHVNAAHLQSTCSPACAPSRVDAIGTVYDVAWVGGGIGVASLAAALFLWRPWQKDAPNVSGNVFVAPTFGGAVVGGRFP
jgi:hypothetical protein